MKKKEKSLKNKGIEKLGDKSTKTSIPNVVLTHVLKLKTAEDYGVKYRNSQSAKKKKQTPKKGGATPRLNQSGTSILKSFNKLFKVCIQNLQWKLQESKLILLVDFQGNINKNLIL